MLAGAPLALPQDLDARAVDQEMQGPRAGSVGDLDDQPARAYPYGGGRLTGISEGW